MVACGAAIVSRGQALEPRFYSNAPVGLNFALGGYVLSSGDVAVDPAVQLDDASIDIHAPFVAYARSLGLFGRSAKFDVAVPYTFLDGSARDANGEMVTRTVDGFADPSFRFSYNFIGAPALTLAEFKDYRQNFVMGASMKVTAPFGQYDSSKLVNIGTHRWSFTPELGMSKCIGRVLLEVSGAVTLYTDNDAFAGQTKEQAPMYSLQGHLVYVFRKKMWVALGATRYSGGRSTVGGVEKGDMQQNTRLGATLGIPVSRRNSIKLYGSSGVETRTGSDFNTYGAAWQYRWGGGL
ncbi:transporter [Pontiella desulfatans]|uniref:transporter n=1 Tax=Pontiella desulfatans TaxID=2750659 RepID=UPI001C9E8A9E|nr:transporter [Pontiella desulfatans]